MHTSELCGVLLDSTTPYCQFETAWLNGFSTEKSPRVGYSQHFHSIWPHFLFTAPVPYGLCFGWSHDSHNSIFGGPLFVSKKAVWIQPHEYRWKHSREKYSIFAFSLWGNILKSDSSYPWSSTSLAYLLIWGTPCDLNSHENKGFVRSVLHVFSQPFVKEIETSGLFHKFHKQLLHLQMTGGNLTESCSAGPTRRNKRPWSIQRCAVESSLRKNWKVHAK